MRKAWKCCAAVLGRVIFIGFGIQIALGVVWMCSAFTGLRGFGEGIVCVGQVLLAGCAAYFFLSGMEGGWRLCLFGSMAFVTFPMAMQCHMSREKYSVVSSGLLLLMGCLLRAGRERRGGQEHKSGQERGSGQECKSEQERGSGRKTACRAAAALSLGVLAACLFLAGQGGQSMGSRAASRFAWTTIYQTYPDWPPECRDGIEYEVMMRSGIEADGISRIMAPYLRERVGEKEAERLMLEISAVALRQNGPRILKEILWDAAGYVISPVVLPLQLQRRAYDSYSGINYSQMLRPAPRLGKRYMDYGCWWFQAGLAITALLSLFRLRRIRFGRWITAFLPGCAVALLCTMGGAGQMDYRNAVYLLYVWIAAMLTAAGEAVRKD